MVKLHRKSVLAITTCTAVLLHVHTVPVRGDDISNCNGADFFLDEKGTCRTCTRCGIGTQSTAESCGSGSGSQGTCVECKAGYYQDKQHTKDRCKPCIQCDPGGGTELSPCTSEHNRECGCKTGFAVNPDLENTCINCDVLPGLDGCTVTTPLTTASPTGTDHVSREVQVNVTEARIDIVSNGSIESLSHAAIIGITITSAVVVVFAVVFCVALFLCCHLKEKRRQPPVRISNISGASSQMTNGAALRMAEEGKPLMTQETGLIVQLRPAPAPAPVMQLKNMETWTPRATPQGTPAGTPHFQRSISEPCRGGNTSSGSTDKFSPNTSVVLEETDSPPKLPDSVRKGAIKCQESERRKQLEERKQRARSIGAHYQLQEFIQKYNETSELAQKLEIQESTSIMDWRNLAGEWGYSQSDISVMRNDAKNGNKLGLIVLFEKEATERYGMKTLEHLLDGLEIIKREDAVCYLSDYLILRGIESTM